MIANSEHWCKTRISWRHDRQITRIRGRPPCGSRHRFIAAEVLFWDFLTIVMTCPYPGYKEQKPQHSHFFFVFEWSFFFCDFFFFFFFFFFFLFKGWAKIFFFFFFFFFFLQ